MITVCACIFLADRAHGVRTRGYVTHYKRVALSALVADKKRGGPGTTRPTPGRYVCRPALPFLVSLLVPARLVHPGPGLAGRVREAEGLHLRGRDHRVPDGVVVEVDRPPRQEVAVVDRQGRPV